jgi:hypothetical protein
MQLHQQPEEEQQHPARPAHLAADTSDLHVQATEVSEAEVRVPRSVTDLLATAQLRHTQRKRLVWMGTGIAVLVALFAILPHKQVALWSYAKTSDLVALIVGLFVLSVGLFALEYAKKTEALARGHDIQRVGALVDRLHTERRMGILTHNELRQALLRLLPRLKASDANLLTVSQKGRLARHLAQLVRFQHDKEFQIVLLRAFEQIGDAQAIPIVESIIQRRPWGIGSIDVTGWTRGQQRPKRAVQDNVRDAAVECLPFLRQRVQEQSIRSTLLRATGQSEETGGQLLRPAEGTTGVGTHDLLRAAPASERMSPASDERELGPP